MTNSKALALRRHVVAELDDMFADLPPLDPFEIKKEEVAALLAALMIHSGANRATLVERLDWEKSRLSHVLSGKANPTIKTIYEFARSLGFDFDLVFRCDDGHRPPQPWEAGSATYFTATTPILSPVIGFVVQTPEQIAEDVTNGKAKRFYISEVHQNAHLASGWSQLSIGAASSSEDWSSHPNKRASLASYGPSNFTSILV